MHYSVRVGTWAKRDLVHISDWIAERSPDGAKRWLTAFDIACENLRRNPHQHSIVSEDIGSGREIGQMFFRTPKGQTYRGVFVIDKDEVILLRVRGPGQPPLQPDELN